jgi:hypothetical protein
MVMKNSVARPLRRISLELNRSPPNSHRAHTEPKGDPPQEETTRICKVRSEVDLEGQVDHCEEEGNDTVAKNRDDQAQFDV